MLKEKIVFKKPNLDFIDVKLKDKSNSKTKTDNSKSQKELLKQSYEDEDVYIYQDKTSYKSDFWDRDANELRAFSNLNNKQIFKSYNDYIAKKDMPYLFLDFEDEKEVTPNPIVPINPTSIFLSADSYSVDEGESVTISATLDLIALEDTIITLSNGSTITIETGNISGSVVVTNPYEDDLYIQGDRNFNIGISNIVSSSNLDTSSVVDITVVDNSTPTILYIDDIYFDSQVFYSYRLIDGSSYIKFEECGVDYDRNGQILLELDEYSGFLYVWGNYYTDDFVYDNWDYNTYISVDIYNGDDNSLIATENIEFDGYYGNGFYLDDYLTQYSNLKVIGTSIWSDSGNHYTDTLTSDYLMLNSSWEEFGSYYYYGEFEYPANPLYYDYDSPYYSLDTTVTLTFEDKDGNLYNKNVLYLEEDEYWNIVDDLSFDEELEFEVANTYFRNEDDYNSFDLKVNNTDKLVDVKFYENLPNYEKIKTVIDSSQIDTDKTLDFIDTWGEEAIDFSNLDLIIKDNKLDVLNSSWEEININLSDVLDLSSSGVGEFYIRANYWDYFTFDNINIFDEDDSGEWHYVNTINGNNEEVVVWHDTAPDVKINIELIYCSDMHIT